jgi:hypothetical protein
VGGIHTGTVTSADGTVIVFDQSGAGPAVVLVQGALMGRADPVMSGLAAGLSRWFTVFSYDRRDSGECAAPARPSRALYRGPCTACSRGKRTTAPEAIVPERREFLITT